MFILITISLAISFNGQVLTFNSGRHIMTVMKSNRMLLN